MNEEKNNDTIYTAEDLEKIRLIVEELKRRIERGK